MWGTIAVDVSTTANCLFILTADAVGFRPLYLVLKPAELRCSDHDMCHTSNILSITTTEVPGPDKGI